MKRYIKTAVVNLKDEPIEDLVEIASNPNTAPEVLADLHKLKVAKITKALAGNPSTPKSILYNFASSVLEHDFAIDCNMWRTLCKNPNLPQELIPKLAKHKNSIVRMSIAENPSTPISVLNQLADDSDIAVIRTVRENPNISGELYAKVLSILSKRLTTGFCTDYVASDNINTEQIKATIISILKKLQMF